METLRSYIAMFTISAGALGTAYAGVNWVDSRYAKAEQVVSLDKKLMLVELRQQLRTALEEYYFLRQQARKYPQDLDIQRELEDAKEAVDLIKEKIKRIESMPS
jgi:hypothetical protein